VYVRIAFAQDAHGVDSAGERPALRVALATLASYTATPASAYAPIWEGWISGAPAPQAPRVQIPHRAMLLFTGPVGVLRDAPSLAWYGSAQGYQEPHLVWPEDQAWYLACEVDEEIEFTVGCSLDASQALDRTLPGAVRRVRYGEPAPLYRDPASQGGNRGRVVIAACVPLTGPPIATTVGRVVEPSRIGLVSGRERTRDVNRGFRQRGSGRAPRPPRTCRCAGSTR
jgi:hypothetical protein